MKKIGILMALLVLLTGGAISTLFGPAQAQIFTPPPPQPSMAPWVGPNTPWVFYNGDWFRNGILYHFYGPKYGWAPYYAYPPAHIVRPAHWYGPKWEAWYRAHPAYWRKFHHAYPHWRHHRAGLYYDEAFYLRHHHGHGRGWHKGYYDD